MEDYELQKLQILDELGHRKFVIPSEVQGWYHQRRRIFQFVLLVIFLVGPWIQFQGQQLIWLNIDKKVFHLFGLTLGAHEAPLVFLLIIAGTLGLAVVTSLLGRVWCGWSCPQTVFIEMVYRRIEKWVEGNAWARRRLRDEEISFKKIRLQTTKWVLYFLVSALIAHSFAAYFVGREPLLEMMQRSPGQNASYFLLIFGLTALLTINFGWFREQFCLIACPYGRIQSLLMDTHSITVTYDTKRGEPRKGLDRGAQKHGDCVSCFKCVSACPTGIDIRNGLQMECIGCTACMDACDQVMDKVGKPAGLIRYSNQSGQPFQLLRPRTLIYLAGVLLAVSVAGWNLSQRGVLDIVLLRGQDSPYQIIPGENGGSILNHVRLKIKNQNHSAQSISIEGVIRDEEFVLNQPRVTLQSQESKELHVFIKFPRGSAHSISTLTVTTAGDDLKQTHQIEVQRLRP